MVETAAYSTTDKLVGEWAIKTFGFDFVFREDQKEACVDIINSFLTNEKNYILQAPTGSGKSIIAMIVAGVLSENYGMRGYILISDLSLIQQYESDLNKYLPDWGVIKGQEQYMCMSNGCSFKMGSCRLAGYTSYAEIKSSYGDCAPYCDYIIQRDKAIAAPVTLCTYQHWLIQQNMVNKKFSATEASVPFPKRDFIICDEAHKIVDIVQSYFSPRMSPKDDKSFDDIISNSSVDRKNKSILLDIKKKLYKEDNVVVLYSLLKEYANTLATIENGVSAILASVSLTYKGRGPINKDEKRLLHTCHWFIDHYESYLSYLKIIEKDNSYLIKTHMKDGDVLVFNCVDESYLMNSYFHSRCGSCLYMSATMGDPVVYSKNSGISKYRATYINSHFNYDNSPIYYIDNYKMSYSNKDTSFPAIITMIENILELYNGYRGVILLSSYDLTNKLYDNISEKHKKRLLRYDNTQDKQEKIDQHKYSTDSVLIGPSLFDGLSLDDDLCRFLIIAKIPYPDLSNNFIKTKMDIDSDWYSSKAALNVIQGIGRGVRSSTDWCCSFILDGCFTSLIKYNRGMFDDSFIQRVKLINEEHLK